MIGKGCLITVVVVVGGGGALANVGDIAARHWATSQVEKRIRATVPNAQGVRAHIRSWPFVKVAVTGHVDEMGARIDRVTVSSLTFSSVDVEIHSLKIKTQPLVAHGKVVVNSIHNGTIAASITASALTSALGVPVSVGSTGFVVRGVPVSVSIRSRSVVVTAAGIGVQSFALPALSLLPCAPSVAFSNQAAVLSCSFDHVPSAFTASA